MFLSGGKEGGEGVRAHRAVLVKKEQTPGALVNYGSEGLELGSRYSLKEHST